MSNNKTAILIVFLLSFGAVTCRVTDNIAEIERARIEASVRVEVAKAMR